MEPFEQIIQTLDSLVGSFETIGLTHAKSLFVLLAGIHLVLDILLWILNRDDPFSLFLKFVKSVFLLTFFWSVINMYSFFVPPIIESFVQIGNEMVGVDTLSPGDVLSRGFNIATTLFTAANGFGLFTNFASLSIGFWTGLIILVTFIIVATEMVLVIVGSKIILAAGTVMLGFSGIRMTHEYAIKYFQAVIYIGLLRLFLILVIGVGLKLTETLSTIIATASTGEFLEAALASLAASLLFGILAIRLPTMGATMLSGGFGLGFGGTIIGTVFTTSYAVSTVSRHIQRAVNNIRSKPTGGSPGKSSASDNATISMKSLREATGGGPQIPTGWRTGWTEKPEQESKSGNPGGGEESTVTSWRGLANPFPEPKKGADKPSPLQSSEISTKASSERQTGSVRPPPKKL